MVKFRIPASNSATMAKKQVPTDSQQSSKTQTNKGRKSRGTNTKTPNAGGHSSREETKIVVISSSTTESENEQGVESSDAEEDKERTPADEGPRSSKIAEKKRRQEGTRKKRTKKRKEDDDGEDEEEKAGATLYKFPMNRVSRIIKSEDSDLKISQESVFLLNRAAEKFLHVFCREAYASAFLDEKNFAAYNHLSEVVSKRKRYQFLSEFIPEKLKAEDAIREAEKQTNLNLHS